MWERGVFGSTRLVCSVNPPEARVFLSPGGNARIVGRGDRGYAPANRLGQTTR